MRDDAYLLRNTINYMRLKQRGSGNDWVIVRELLHRAKVQGSFYSPMKGLPGHFVEFAASVMYSWGLVEIGERGIEHCWLTRRGENLLSFLNQFGCDYYSWPPWARSDGYKLELPDDTATSTNQEPYSTRSLDKSKLLEMNTEGGV